MHVSFLGEVATGTYLNLGLLVGDGVFGGMDKVATGAGDIGAVVMAAFPCHAFVVLMAGHTYRILLVGRNWRVFAEGDHRLLATFVVTAHGTVAGFALEIGHR